MSVVGLKVSEELSAGFEGDFTADSGQTRSAPIDLIRLLGAGTELVISLEVPHHALGTSSEFPGLDFTSGIEGSQIRNPIRPGDLEARLEGDMGTQGSQNAF